MTRSVAQPLVVGDHEAAQMLGLSPGTLRNWRARGIPNTPPFVRLGGAVRYRKVDLEKWLDQQTVRPGEGVDE